MPVLGEEREAHKPAAQRSTINREACLLHTAECQPSTKEPAKVSILSSGICDPNFPLCRQNEIHHMENPLHLQVVLYLYSVLNILLKAHC